MLRHLRGCGARIQLPRDRGKFGQWARRKLKDGPEVGTFPGDNSRPNRRHRQQSNGRHQTLWPDSSARQNHWTCVRRGKESSGTTWLTIISRLSSTAYPHPGPTAHFSFGSPTDNITSSTPMPEKRWSRAQLQFPKQDPHPLRFLRRHIYCPLSPQACCSPASPTTRRTKSSLSAPLCEPCIERLVLAR